MQVELNGGRVLTLPDVHVMIEGVPNSGKTRFAASAEKPELVLACDPISKMPAYFDRGTWDGKVYTGAQGQPVWIITSRMTGQPIIQLEGYYDEDPELPTAMTSLLARMPSISAEVKVGMWRTVVIDSWTQLEWIARIRRTNGNFKTSNSPYLEAMDDLKSLVNSRLMNLRCNLIVIFHIETKVVRNKQGTVVQDARMDVGGGEQSYTVQAIGQLKNLPNVFGECYLAIAPVDGSNNYVLQTVRNADFRTLCSRIGAPNLCPNEWREIFTGYINAQAALPSAQPAPVTPQEEEAST
jgi:hypothetical protein